MEAASANVPAKPFVPRITAACEACRLRKRRCDGQVPCSYCVAKKQQCSFTVRKKRGPKKRGSDCMEEDDVPTSALVPVSDPSTKEYVMSEQAEAQMYFNTCWKHLHRIHALSNASKILNPITPAQKVQAYATFAYTARLCGNKSKSTVYIDQARAFAGQVYDTPDADSVAGLLLMSHYSMLVFDMPRVGFYSSIGVSLSKMIPAAKMDFKLMILCKLLCIMSDHELSTEQKTDRFRDLLAYMSTIKTDPMITVFMLLTRLNQALVQLLNTNIFVSSATPMSTFLRTVFDIVDQMVVTEAARLHIFEIMDNIIASFEAIRYPNAISFVTKLLIPAHRAILNWKSGRIPEAMQNALNCFASLQLLGDDLVFGLLSHLPQVYMFGALVKFFVEQGQLLLAQQMVDKVKQICSRMSPDLDEICTLLDVLLQPNHFLNSSTTSTSPSTTSVPSPTPVSPSPPTSSSPTSTSPSPSPNLFPSLLYPYPPNTNTNPNFLPTNLVTQPPSTLLSSSSPTNLSPTNSFPPSTTFYSTFPTTNNNITEIQQDINSNIITDINYAMNEAYVNNMNNNNNNNINNNNDINNNNNNDINNNMNNNNNNINNNNINNNFNNNDNSAIIENIENIVDLGEIEKMLGL